MTIKLKKPLIPYDGWTIEEDNGQKSFDPTFLTLHREPEQESSYLSGTVMRERMKGKGISASVLDYLIEHPELAPAAWKETHNGNIQFIFFWGTIYRGSNGDLYVRYWCFSGGRWRSDYRWLDRGWYDDCPSAVLGKSSVLAPVHSSDTKNLELRVQKLEEIITHHNLGL